MKRVGGVRTSGFTIVELLIVVVVIAVLAAITIVAFNGVQARARDSQRRSDVRAITKALELYKISNGAYPAATPSCWESSNAASFMEYLVAGAGSAGIDSVPVDPVNNSSYYYSYCRYSAGVYNCDAARGDYVVVTIKRLETNPTGAGESSWICPLRNWNVDNGNEFSWSWGAYER